MNSKGCFGRVACLSTLVVVSRAHILVRGHYSTVAGREQAIPDDGAHLEKDHETCQGKSRGNFLKFFI